MINTMIKKSLLLFFALGCFAAGKAQDTLGPQGDFFGGLPSPLDMAQVFQTKGKFHKEWLYPVSARTTHTSSFSKSIVTGLNYEDMCYCMVFNQSNDYIAYLNVTKAMYDIQGVPFFSESSSVLRIKKNVMSSDSIFAIVTDQHNQAEDFMSSNDRSQVSLLVSIAANIEALYLFCMDADKTKPENIQPRMSDEKFMLEEYEGRLKKESGTDNEDLLKKISALKELIKEKMTVEETAAFCKAVTALRTEFLKN
jgi:hypothetical protein